jgi:hypothetical protein
MVQPCLWSHRFVAQPPQRDAYIVESGLRGVMLVKLVYPCPMSANEDRMNPKLLDEINEKMKAVLAQGPAADIEKNLRALLAGAFSRLDLVTREEFDVQREVLLRTRAKLAELEKKVAALEADTSRTPVSR